MQMGRILDPRVKPCTLHGSASWVATQSATFPTSFLLFTVHTSVALHWHWHWHHCLKKPPPAHHGTLHILPPPNWTNDALGTTGPNVCPKTSSLLSLPVIPDEHQCSLFQAVDLQIITGPPAWPRSLAPLATPAPLPSGANVSCTLAAAHCPKPSPASNKPPQLSTPANIGCSCHNPLTISLCLPTPLLQPGPNRDGQCWQLLTPLKAGR